MLSSSALVLKAARHIEENPDSYQYTINRIPRSPTDTGCILGWLPQFHAPPATWRCVGIAIMCCIRGHQGNGQRRPRRRQKVSWYALLAVVFCGTSQLFGASPGEGTTPNEPAPVDLRWGVKIPMRDGVELQATVYTPKGQTKPAPCVFTLTPYIAQTYHDRGMYFASHGYPFLTVDVRGRGNSQGQFRPLIQEAHDGYDVVEWLAQQPYCNGKIAMWGGSYAGYDQWATASQMPPHLATIVPAAAPYAGVDFPFRSNIFYTYDVQWLSEVNGRAAQTSLYGDDLFWKGRFRQWLEAGEPFNDLGNVLGESAAIFREWVAHPYPDGYWDQYNPTAAQYAKLTLPILTITGSHDDDQLGALQHYREFMRNASAESKARHYLIIGPWDHAGTRTPNAQVGGLTFGPASLVDLPKLHLEWYAWTMLDGAKPAFLQKPVAYYVMQADRWRYADTLEAVTATLRPYYLDSRQNATDVLASGSLQVEATGTGRPDHFISDPRATDIAKLEYGADTQTLTDQRLVYARRGRELVYHTAPFEKDTEVSGFFKLSAWIAIDQPDTDLEVRVYEIGEDGGSIALSSDLVRARYRDSVREPKLVRSKAALRYEFEHFTFVSRVIRRNSRLRLVIAPVNSIYSEKNYNSGGVVAAETVQDARLVTVTLYHDRAHPSVLYVPVGQP